MTIIFDGTSGIAGTGSVTGMTVANTAISGTITPSQLASTSQYYGFKNRLINGNMLIWQRGTSSTSTGYQTVDRWSFYADSSRSISQSSDAPNGYRYSVSMSGTGSTGLTQKIESYNVSDLYGQTITVSFWLKQTTGAGSNAISVALSYATAQDNFGTTTSIGSTNISTTSSWAQYSATFTNLPSGVINGLQCTIVTTSGSAVAFLLTGVQLELGSSATSFDFRPITTELQLCQRYYEDSKGTPVLVTIGTNSMGYGSTTSNWVFSSIPFLVQKRANPTMTITGSSGGSNVVSVPWFGTSMSPKKMLLICWLIQ